MEIKETRVTSEIATQLTLKSIFEGMAVNLIPEKSIAVTKTVNFYFPDIDQYWSVQVRKGIAEIQSFKMKGAAISIEMNSNDWKKLATGVEGGVGSYLSGNMSFKKGSLLDFKSFFEMFKN